jgi:hypothetical protein
VKRYPILVVGGAAVVAVLLANQAAKQKPKSKPKERPVATIKLKDLKVYDPRRP